MTGIKDDIIYSSNNPIICPDCVERLRRDRISDETITLCKKEIKKIRKVLFYRITDFIKDHPVFAILISAVFAIILGTIGSIFGSFIHEFIKF